MRAITLANNWSNYVVGLVARPIISGALGAGAANLVGRYFPSVGGTVGMAVTGGVLAVGTETAFYVFGRDASVNAVDHAASIKQLGSDYFRADAAGRKAIEAEIRSSGYLSSERSEVLIDDLQQAVVEQEAAKSGPRAVNG